MSFLGQAGYNGIEMVVEHFGLANDAPYAFEGCIVAPTFCPERSARMNPTLDPSPICSIGEGRFGAPKGRYGANLGHKVDDESGLVYMRARYYDPTSGRFISEDPAEKGLNWFAFCKSDPATFVDKSGKDSVFSWGAALIGFLIGFDTMMLSALIFDSGHISARSFFEGLISSTFSGFSVFQKEAERVDASIKKLLDEEKVALTSPETRAANESEAAPAMFGFAYESGEIIAYLVMMSLADGC